MHFILRLFFLACCALPVLPAIADNAQETALRIEQVVASCRGDLQCEAAVRKRETLAAEKQRQREAADQALKQRDPVAYYLTVLGRLLIAAAFIGGAAGLYVLAMHVLFGKKKRRPKKATPPSPIEHHEL
ncbi:MAG TPA: hypothetical protein VM571_06015 [Noviherbaspirillum sp.]|nr:hypothetical protein [Noviherbaspirillum sp.]